MSGAQLDRDALVAAVASTSCMTELLSVLGLARDKAGRKRMSDRLRRDGIDRSHWVRSPRTVYTREELADAVARSTSVAGVLRHLGRPQAGGTHHHIARRIRAEGLDTDHFTGSAHNRGTTASRLTADDILVVLPAGSLRRKTPQLRRALRDKGVPDRCDECVCPPRWRGQRLVLVVEHRNGDWLDNRIGNLRLLCPNCHSQTATWCRRKTGS